jgi:hypothetical protein
MAGKLKRAMRLRFPNTSSGLCDSRLSPPSDLLAAEAELMDLGASYGCSRCPLCVTTPREEGSAARDPTPRKCHGKSALDVAVAEGT